MCGSQPAALTATAAGGTHAGGMQAVMKGWLQLSDNRQPAYHKPPLGG